MLSHNTYITYRDRQTDNNRAIDALYRIAVAAMAYQKCKTSKTEIHLSQTIMESILNQIYDYQQ